MRRKDREVTNIIEILQIIEKAKVLHLALFDADYMSSYLTGRGRIYFLAPPNEPCVRVSYTNLQLIFQL